MKERLVKYFELARKQSTLGMEGTRELVHLEEALIDDVDNLEHNISPEFIELMWKFIHASIELLCGPYAVIDTGSTWDVMEELLDRAFPKLTGKERMAIADLVGGKIACGCYPDRKEYIKQFRKK